MNIIYALVDPRTSSARYVGMSTRGSARPEEHLWMAQNGEHTHKASWIRSLDKLGLAYGIEVLEECETPEELPERERYWIKKLRAEGADLTNHTDGGEGLLNPDDSVRRKIADNMPPGHYQRAKERMLGNASWSGRKHTEESKRKIRGWWTKEQRLQQSKRQKGRVKSREECRRLGRALKGKSKTESHIKSLKASWTPERRAAASARAKEQWEVRRASRDRDGHIP